MNIKKYMQNKWVLCAVVAIVSLLIGIALHAGFDKNDNRAFEGKERDTLMLGSKEKKGGKVQESSESIAVSTTTSSTDEEVNIRVYGMRNRAVVNITTEVLAYSWFFEPLPQEGGVGSGSIIDKRGYVVTNFHVIQNASKVYVTLWDGSRENGTIVGYDIENDLAVVKIDPKKRELHTIPFGDSTKLKIGQRVLAIGNPFAFDRTLTVGIISGLGRPIRNSKNIVIQNMIQTDASINPGNSGGPLLNTRGELIGVNTLIYSPNRGGSVGVGFSVPSQTAVRVVKDIIEYGKVQRGWIYWKVQPLFQELVRHAGLPVDRGLLVHSVERGRNADDVGIRGGTDRKAVRFGRTIVYLGGDIVTKINGIDVFSIAHLLEALEQTRPKQEIAIEYYRGNSKKTTSIILEERPEGLQL